MGYAVPLNTLPSLVREFASYKAVMQNASEKTISEYLLDLRTFFRFLRARELDVDVHSEDFINIDFDEKDSCIQVFFSRDGKVIEELGYYNPLKSPAEIVVDEEITLKWLNNGAIPTDTVRNLLSKAGVMKKFHDLKQGK